LRFNYIKFYKKELIDVIKVGIPSGIQSSLFSLSNVLIQSTTNSFGKVAMAGISYAQQIEGYVYTSMNAVSVAIMTFISQNYGSKNYDRIKKTLFYGLAITSVVGLVLGVASVLICKPLVGLLADVPEVVDYSFNRILIVSLPYFTCGIMEIFTYSMRGLGKSFTSMIIVLVGACLLRILWVEIIFEFVPNLFMVYVSYPVSWVATALVSLFVLIPTLKKLKIQASEESLQG